MYVLLLVVVKGKGGRRGGCVQKKESGEQRQKRHMNLGWAKFIKINHHGDGCAFLGHWIAQIVCYGMRPDSNCLVVCGTVCSIQYEARSTRINIVKIRPGC